MVLVRAPKKPLNGLSRWKELACCQSTFPVTIGISAEANAKAAEPVATGRATRVIHLTPNRLTMAKTTPSAAARIVTETPGMNHC